MSELEESPTTFAAELRRLRQSAGLTLEALAEASGVSARAIGGLERGHSLGPQRRTVTALADGLGLGAVGREILEKLADAGRPRPTTAAAGWCVPPRPVPDFAGRDAELARLAELAGAGGLVGSAGLASGSGPAASVVVLSGPGGIGKTTLAVEAGRRLADERGLSLYHLDLRGLDVDPLDPGTALFRLLRAFGVGSRDIPDDLDGRAGRYRTQLAERPALVVLDNVRDEEQVWSLLPGTGAGLVMVTSRRLLTGLQGVERLTVPALGADDALGLLASIAGGLEGDRAEGLSDLVSLCGGLPLALRIIGNRLATRPAWTAGRLARRLEDAGRRLERINAGDLQITAAFAMSYDQPSPAARRLCRRLALVPGPDFDASLASVLTGASVPDTEDLLDELHELGLLAQTAELRYGFHDLIRLFAGDRLVAEEEPAEREALNRAMAEWLLEVTVAAGRWFEPDWGAPPPDWRRPVDLSTSAAALGWLQTEADNWIGAVRIAASQPGPRLQAQIPTGQRRGVDLVGGARHVQARGVDEEGGVGDVELVRRRVRGPAVQRRDAPHPAREAPHDVGEHHLRDTDDGADQRKIDGQREVDPRLLRTPVSTSPRRDLAEEQRAFVRNEQSLHTHGVAAGAAHADRTPGVVHRDLVAANQSQSAFRSAESGGQLDTQQHAGGMVDTREERPPAVQGPAPGRPDRRSRRIRRATGEGVGIGAPQQSASSIRKLRNKQAAAISDAHIPRRCGTTLSQRPTHLDSGPNTHSVPAETPGGPQPEETGLPKQCDDRRGKAPIAIRLTGEGPQIRHQRLRHRHRADPEVGTADSPAKHPIDGSRGLTASWRHTPWSQPPTDSGPAPPDSPSAPARSAIHNRSPSGPAAPGPCTLIG